MREKTPLMSILAMIRAAFRRLVWFNVDKM